MLTAVRTLVEPSASFDETQASRRYTAMQKYLTISKLEAKGPRMAILYRILPAAPVAALLILAGCNGPETIVADQDDPQAADLADAPPVELPPAIAATRTYRCKDNSLLYADYYTNNTVHVRAERTAEPVILTSESGTPPFTAEGYSITANADQVTYTAPGKGTQSCHV